MRRVTTALALVFVVSCGPIQVAGPPPTLGAVAMKAYNSHRIQMVLDLIRDTAIDANAQPTPLLDTNLTRQIVLWHKASIEIIHAQNQDWPLKVMETTQTLRSRFGSRDHALLGSYFGLAWKLLEEAK